MDEIKIKTLNLDDLIEACFNVYQEIGLQIGEPRTILLRKIISNLECINLLLAGQFTHEILILLRSAFETVLLFCYLTTHLDKQQEYIYDSELIEFKNTFILVKNCKKDIETGSNPDLDINAAIKWHTDIFNSVLSEENKKYILKELKIDKYIITEDNFAIFDKFFRTNNRVRKPFFMDMEKMCKELPKFNDIDAQFRDLIFSDYNLNSQVTHGQYHLWSRGFYTDAKFIENVKSQLVKIVTYPLIYLKPQVNIDLIKLSKLKAITDQYLESIYKNS